MKELQETGAANEENVKTTQFFMKQAKNIWSSDVSSTRK